MTQKFRVESCLHNNFAYRRLQATGWGQESLLSLAEGSGQTREATQNATHFKSHDNLSRCCVLSPFCSFATPPLFNGGGLDTKAGVLVPMGPSRFLSPEYTVVRSSPVGSSPGDRFQATDVAGRLRPQRWRIKISTKWLVVL